MKILLILLLAIITSCSNMLQEGLDSREADEALQNSVQNETNNTNIQTTFKIMGKVSFNGENMSSITVSLTGNEVNETTVTDANGNFIFSNLTNGTYTVAPEATSAVISPTETDATIENKDATDINFTCESIYWDMHHGLELDEVIYNTIQTSDGGYISVGYTTSNNALKDAYIVKLTGGGSVQWEKIYGDLYDDEAYEIIETQTGYIVAGYTIPSDDFVGSDFWVFTLTKNGALKESKTYGTSFSEAALSMTKISNGGYILAGYTFNADSNKDAWVLKIDNTLVKEWDMTIGGSNYDSAFDIIESTDGNFVLTGTTRSYSNGGVDAWIVALDQSGNILWQNNFGDTDNDYAYAITETDDNSFLIAGSKTSISNNNSDAWIIAVNNAGNLIWETTYGSDDDESLYAIYVADNGFVAAGNSSAFSNDSNFYFLHIDATGTLQLEKKYECSGKQKAYSIIGSHHSGYILSGSTETNDSGTNGRVISINSEGGF